MEVYKAAESINTLGEFCGRRDIEYLSQECLLQKYGFKQADVVVLYGGSIPVGGDVAANAMKNGVAKYLIISGGEGHTTESLREKIKSKCETIQTENNYEAEIFADYIKSKYGISPDFLEKTSTNCGNNVTNTLEVLKQNNITAKNIIIIQDATMQQRMDAGFRKYVNSDINIINYASYSAKVVVRNGKLAFEKDTWGMWDMERYISLLMGEIPRLTDDENGYGPNGKEYIAHVDIPYKVKEAFLYLKQYYGEMIRTANPAYASK